MTNTFVSVGSARVAYRVLGMGPAVLLVNGTGGGDGHWGDLVERLARNRTVVTLDYSGAGETTDDGAPLDLPTLARQVAAVAEAVGAPHVDLVGHSLGAAIATVLAAERPELVRTLTLVAGFLTADEPRLKLTFELWRRLIAADRESFIQLLALTTLSDKFFASPLAAHLDALAQGILTGTNWEGLVRQVELDLRVDIHAEASRVRCPTLVVGCAHDQIVTRTRDLCARIPDATFSEINAGYQAYFEASERSLPPSSWPSRTSCTRQGVFHPRLPDRLGPRCHVSLNGEARIAIANWGHTVRRVKQVPRTTRWIDDLTPSDR